MSPHTITQENDTTGAPTVASQKAQPVEPNDGALTPLTLKQVRLLKSGFWGERSRINASNTLPHCLHWLERAGWLPNFDRATEGTLPDGRQGREFADSEVYKLLEAYCWENAVHPSNELEQVIRSITERIGAAQEADGYLNTNFGRPGQSDRYSDLEWGHELYNYGHLLQAAVARLRSHGEDELVAIARRVADHICDQFGGNGIQSVCGHPEVELGLMEFGRATGEPRYTEQARLFIERRGHGVLKDIEWGRSYYQDDIPVRSATVLRGHAVRALYLAAAVVDLAVDTADDELLSTLETQWENTIAKRTYITGGMGSHHQDEAFGEDYELPSDRAYCESCAGVASVMFSWRLLLATGKARYADLIERTLYNIVATASSEDGKSFFYSNTLHRRSEGAPSDPDHQSKRADSSQRASWFDVACCPNNIARLLASLGGYIATTDAGGVQIHQFADTDIEIPLDNGQQALVQMRTRYPDEARVQLTVRASPVQPWSLSIRVPDWASGASVSINGETQPALPGYVELERTFLQGDLIELILPSKPRVIRADPRIDAVRGSVAVEVGPRVYCLESVDLPDDTHVDNFILNEVVEPVIDRGTVWVSGRLDTRTVTPSWPYSSDTASGANNPAMISLVPYHRWANRGLATMRIWMRTS